MLMRYQVKPPPKIGRYGVTVGINPGPAQYPVPKNLYISQQVVNWIQQLGATQLRGQISASFIWRNQSDPWQLWDWSPLDDMVNKAMQAGLRFTFPIRGLPSWGLINPAMQADNVPHFLDDPQTVATIAVAVASRYNGVFNIPGYGPMAIGDIELANEEANQFFTDTTATLTVSTNVVGGNSYTAFELSTLSPITYAAGTQFQWGGTNPTHENFYLTQPVRIGDGGISVGDINGNPYVPGASHSPGSNINAVYYGLRTSPYYEYDGTGGVYNSFAVKPQPARDPYYHQQTILAAGPALRACYPWNTFGQIGTGAAWWWFDDNYRDFFAGLGSSLQYVDYINAHTYSNASDPITPGGDVHNPGEALILSNMQTGVTQAGFPHMPCRITEIGWSVPSDAATYAIQAARYQEVFPLFTQSYSFVQQVDIFTINNLTNNPGASLVSASSFTPAYTYLQNLISTAPDWGPRPIIGEHGRMPYDALTNADNFRVLGSLTVVSDPGGNSGNVNVAGTLVTTGTASFASALTASSISAGGLNSSFSAGLTVSGGEKVDYISGFTTPTASSQSASSANTPITMTSGFSSGGPNYIYVQASGTATATILLTPTSSASTSGFFQDGVEVTIVNNSASATNIAIPSGNFGSLTGTPASMAITAGHAARFKYLAALQTWVPLS